MREPTEPFECGSAWCAVAAKMARAPDRIVGNRGTWRPHTVLRGRSSEALSEPAAFELIASHLERSVFVEIGHLHGVPSGKAYAMRFLVGTHRVYVRFQIKRVFVALNFHIDAPGEKHNDD